MSTLTRPQAEAIFAEVKEFYANYLKGWDGGDLRLSQDWDYPDDGPRDWAIVWEEGPDGWTYYFCEHYNAQPNAMFTEPYSGWALCLYPPDTAA